MGLSPDRSPALPHTSQLSLGTQCDNECDRTLSSNQLTSVDSPTLTVSGQGDCNDLATVSCHVNELTDEQKYHILTSRPAQLKEYPINNQKRRFQPKWVQEFQWIRYSASTDGVFCAPCLLFSSARFNSEFITTPFCDWKNAVGTSRGTLNRHSSSRSHLQCLEQAVTFIAVMDKKTAINTVPTE